jgi:hypothetical protein
MKNEGNKWQDKGKEILWGKKEVSGDFSSLYPCKMERALKG